MQQHDNIDFITGKIKQLETALLHIYSDSLLKLPSSIIQTLRIDDEGNVWFVIDKPSQEINEFDRQFYVGLNFYRKGAPFFLNTYGLARLVNDSAEIATLPYVLQNQNGSDKILVSVKILTATYREQEPEITDTLFHKCKHYFKSMFAYNVNHTLTFENGPYLS